MKEKIPKDKLTFIRKNGKLIPIKKKDGQGPSGKGSGKKVNHAAKGSYHEGKSDYHSSKAKKYRKKTAGRQFGMGAIGAIAGLVVGGRFKQKLLGGVLGLAAGSVVGINTGTKTKKANKHTAKSFEHLQKFNTHWDKEKNKDAFGDGSSRRSYQRGRKGKKY